MTEAELASTELSVFGAVGGLTAAAAVGPVRNCSVRHRSGSQESICL